MKHCVHKIYRNQKQKKRQTIKDFYLKLESETIESNKNENPRFFHFLQKNSIFFAKKELFYHISNSMVESF